MIGVVLMSHGGMAEGTLDTLKMFFGNEIPQIKAIAFHGEDAPEAFDEKLKEAIKEVDSGHGVVGFCDLAGGTPSNRCCLQLSKRFYVISGMNLGMIMEFLGKRLADEDVEQFDFNALVETGKNSVVSISEQFKDFIK